jgi:hypothetical protein
MMPQTLSALLLLAAAAQERGFTPVTRESGVEAAIDAKYEKDPKWWLSGLHLVDLDGDGDLDLFLSAHGGGGALALLNDGKGHFAAAPGSYPATEIHLPYDLDEDGRPDLLMTYQDGGGQWWLNKSKPGELAFEAAGTPHGTNQARVSAMLDFNRDGRVDWVRSAGGALVFEFGDGGARFKPGPSVPVTEGYRFEHAVIPADIDGDGDFDLVLEWGRYAFGQGKCRLYRNDGEMRFTDVTADAGLYEEGLSIKGAGDFDHDGDIDLIALEKGIPFSIFLNDGKGRFTKLEGAVPGLKGTVPLASWGIAVMTDFDNDGVGDLLVNGRNFLKALRGSGGGRFVSVNKEWGIADVAAASVDDGHCFGDFDGDGDLDIVGYRTAGDHRRIDLYRNDLPRRSWIKVRPVGAAGNRAAAGAKIRLFAPGAEQLLWHEEVAVYDRQEAHSYYAHGQTERHFGLGDRDAADVRVDFYPSGKTVWARQAKAGQTTVVRED